MARRILVVDDEEAIQALLQTYLRSLGYEVDAAFNGAKALEMLEKRHYDLVLSDINMPVMKGFELLAKVREKFPATKRALITAYDVDEYLKLALDHDVGNIIPKANPFNFDDVKMVVHNLISEDFFGLESYLREGATIHGESLRTQREIGSIAEKIVSSVEGEDRQGKLRIVLIELLTNAMFYGARGVTTANKEDWETDFELPEKDAIETYWGDDGEKMGFSVVDKGGHLSKKDVLHWLHRQTDKDEQGLPLGVFDTHGRGFFIARRYVDSLLINVKSTVKTEIIGLNYLEPAAGRHRPIYINEA